MAPLTRITFDPDAWVASRASAVTVGTIVGLLASGRMIPEILAAYPYLEEADIYAGLSYAACRVKG